MAKWIFAIVIYLVLGVSYAIDFFHSSYEDYVEDQGMKVSQFFVLTILACIIWPIQIIMFAIMDIRGDR